MKKLMILGASYSQLPLYDTARKMGIYTIAASTPGDWPGFEAADESSFTDISDPEAVLKAAREYEVDGITTCCLDTGVRAIGYVCENMGLKGLSAGAARVSTDKFLMKEAFARGGVRCAKHVCVRSREELERALDRLSLPVIVKPVDLMGSRGMYRCAARAEALECYEKTMEATGKDYCLVEEFIQGEIFGCEAMMCDGRLVYCLPNNIDAYQSHVPTPVGHSVPYKKEAALGAEVRRQLMLAIRAVGLDNCPVNCDLIERDGSVYVIEITGRAGATCLPEMVSLYYGINYYEAIVRLALGMPVEELFHRDVPRRANLSKVLLSEKDGTVKAIHNRNTVGPNSRAVSAPGLVSASGSVSGPNSRAVSAPGLVSVSGSVSGPNSRDPGAPNPVGRTRLVELSFNISPGEQVRRYENGRDRLGQVIIDGDTLEACEERLAQVLSKINIEFIT